MTIKLAFRKRMVMALFLLSIAIFLSCPTLSRAQGETYTTKEGDTLWSICERHYGDAELWPKLWQMNPFITNPHLILPGEIITLFEKEPVKKTEPPKVDTPKVDQVVTEKGPGGIDVSSITVLNSIGFLSLTELEPWGRVYASNSSRLILSKGDTLFANFGNRTDVKVGDKLSIVRPSGMLTHPLTEKSMGYVVKILGTLVLKELINKGIYLAQITEGFKDISIGDIIVPCETVPQCVEPLPTEQDSRGIIVATKDMVETFGRYSVVYLDRGSNHGIRAGNVLELVKIQYLPDPPFKTEPVEKIISEFFKSSTAVEAYNRLFEKKQLYESGVGQMIVVDSRPDTATAVVLSTKENLKVGTFFRGLHWSETPDSLTSVSNCSVK